MQQIDRDALLTSTGRIRWHTTDTAGRERYRILEKRDVIPPKNTLHAWLRVSMPAATATRFEAVCPFPTIVLRPIPPLN